MLITSIEKSDKSGERFSIYVDNKFVFSITEEDYLRLALYEKKEITQEEIHYIKYDVNLRSARSAGVRYLALKIRTEKEVRKKLCDQGFEGDIINSAIDELKASGYINDLLYAQKYIYDRLKLKPGSKRSLQYELERKGIDRDYISEALTEVEIDDQSTAEALVRKKFGKYDLTEEKIKKKVYSFLQHRGFDHEVINEVIRSRDRR